MKQIFLDGTEKQLERLSKIGDPLEKVEKVINWELFRGELTAATRKSNYSKGGRPAFDVLLMYKIVMLMQWFNLSYHQAEYQINDRLSFMRFLGVEIGFKLPDKNTIFDFKEALKIGETDHKLFNLFLKNLEENGVVMHEGTIIDASFVDVPKQRNSHRENEIIKSGEVPIDMIAKGKNSFCQKDLEAQWTKKNNETHYGYKYHVKIDKNTKIITGFEVTDASVHDSQKFVELIDENDVEVWADSAYVGKTFEKEIKEKQPTIKLHICEKGYKKHPLTDEQKASNKEKSRVRCRVEHVFGYLSGGVREMTARCIGFSRVAREICEKNLAYNLQRYAYLASR